MVCAYIVDDGLPSKKRRSINDDVKLMKMLITIIVRVYQVVFTRG